MTPPARSRSFGRVARGASVKRHTGAGQEAGFIDEFRQRTRGISNFSPTDGASEDQHGAARTIERQRRGEHQGSGRYRVFNDFWGPAFFSSPSPCARAGGASPAPPPSAHP